MKKTTFFKTLLLAAGLLGGSNAWATDYTTKTFNFQTTETSALTLSSTVEATSTNSLYEVTVPSTMTGYFAFDYVSGNNYWGIRTNGNSSTNGLRCYSNGASTWRYCALLSLKAGSIVTFTGTGFNGLNGENKCFDVLSSDDYTSEYSSDGKTITVTIDEDAASAVNVYIKANAKNSVAVVHSLVIQTPVTEGAPATPGYTIVRPDGTARILSLSCDTEDATIYYSESTSDVDEEGWTEYTSAITTTSSKIYAYAEKNGVKSDVAPIATTAGSAITLNAPSIANTAYSNGSYTVSLTSTQTSLSIQPESVTIHYTIDDGTEQTVVGTSTTINVTAGSTVNAYITSTGYTNSSETEWQTGAQLNLPANWTQNYVSVVANDVTMYYDTESSEYKNCISANAGGNYYVYSTDGSTAATNANAGFEVYNANTARKWMMRPAGIMNYTATTSSVALYGLTTGQIVKCEYITSSYGGISAGSNLTKLESVSYGTTAFFEVGANGIAYLNISRNAYVKTLTVYDINVTATIGSTGYATFSSTYALDFTDVTALTAYTATACDGETVTLTKVTGTVAANTGLVIKGETADIPVVAEGDAQDGNMLFALDGSYSTLGAGTNGTNYVLSVQEDKVVFAPIEGTGAPVTAGHAALFVPEASSAKLRLVFADELANGINGVTAVSNADAAIYNLSGQRVNAAYKGIVIKNGKKYLNK